MLYPLYLGKWSTILKHNRINFSYIRVPNHLIDENSLLFKTNPSRHSSKAAPWIYNANLSSWLGTLVVTTIKFQTNQVTGSRNTVMDLQKPALEWFVPLSTNPSIPAKVIIMPRGLAEGWCLNFIWGERMWLLINLDRLVNLQLGLLLAFKSDYYMW